MTLLNLAIAAAAVLVLTVGSEALGWGLVSLAVKAGNRFPPGIQRSAARIGSYLLLADLLLGLLFAASWLLRACHLTTA